MMTTDRVKLFKSLFHQLVSLGWYDGRHRVLGPVMFGPQLTDLFVRLVRQQVDLDHVVQSLKQATVKTVPKYLLET